MAIEVSSTPSRADLERISRSRSCAMPAPIFTAPPPACCACACTTCPPKVRLRDYIRITPSTVETCFLIGEPTCDAEVAIASKHCIVGVLRKRGACTPTLELRPLRATPEGHVCFTWSDTFWQVGDNRYELDIIYDGTCVTTVGLNVVGCHLAVLNYVHNEGTQCSVSPECAPQIEEEEDTRLGECGGQEC